MNPSVRVCHVAVHPVFDQRIFHRMCWSLAKAGYDTHLLARGGSDQPIVNGIQLHSIDQIQESGLGIQLKRRWKRIDRAFRIAHQLDAQIYHLHDVELLVPGLWLKFRTGAAVIFDSHEDNLAYVRQKFFLPRIVRWLLAIMIFFSEWLAALIFDAIVTADEGVANIYRHRYKARQVVVLHNFPRLDLFTDTNGSKADAVEKKYDLVYHGTIPRYHLEVAFRTAEELRKRGVNARWLFFGSCPEHEWAKAELQQRHLADNFEIDPKRIPHEQVIQRVKLARIGYIPLPDLPKFQHNIPTKLFEFMALEMPTVLSDLPASRPFVGDGRCAIMVPPDDYGAYADAIQRLLENPELCASMGQVARSRVVESFNWQAESHKLLALYEELVKKKHVQKTDH